MMTIKIPADAVVVIGNTPSKAEKERFSGRKTIEARNAIGKIVRCFHTPDKTVNGVLVRGERETFVGKLNWQREFDSMAGIQTKVYVHTNSGERILTLESGSTSVYLSWE